MGTSNKKEKKKEIISLEQQREELKKYLQDENYMTGKKAALKKDFKTAKACYSWTVGRRKKEGNPYASFELAKFREHGLALEGGKKIKKKEEIKKAAKTYIALANKYDEPLFQYHAARCLYNKIGGEQNKEKALELYKKAALYIPKAALELGELLENTNPNEALEWYEKAKKLNLAPLPEHYSNDERLNGNDLDAAQNGINRCKPTPPLLAGQEEDGKKEEQIKTSQVKELKENKEASTPAIQPKSTRDIQKMLEIAIQEVKKKEVNSLDPPSPSSYAELYALEDEKRKIERKKVVNNFSLPPISERKTPVVRSPEDEYLHGRMYMMAENYKEAFQCFGRAATQGHGLAMYRIGLFLERGLIGKPDPNRAISFFKKAIEHRCTEAAIMMVGWYGNHKSEVAQNFYKSAAYLICAKVFELSKRRGADPESELEEAIKAQLQFMGNREAILAIATVELSHEYAEKNKTEALIFDDELIETLIDQLQNKVKEKLGGSYNLPLYTR